jgi:hypothetical protein
MSFTSDVLLRAGYLVPPDRELSLYDPLLPYFDAASRLTFEQYVKEFLLPYVQYVDPAATLATVLHECSLRSIARFLRGADNVFVLGTEDDPILDPDEREFLKVTFAERAEFFQHGGHCGNFQYAPFARRMQEMMGAPGKAAKAPQERTGSAEADKEASHV